MPVQSRPAPGQHRRRQERVSYVGAGVRLGLVRLVALDLPLVAATGLLVMGVMLIVFSAVSCFIIDNVWLSWLTALSGTFSWMFAIGIFCIYPPGPSPEDSKPR